MQVLLFALRRFIFSLLLSQSDHQGLIRQVLVLFSLDIVQMCFLLILIEGFIDFVMSSSILSIFSRLVSRQVSLLALLVVLAYLAWLQDIQVTIIEGSIVLTQLLNVTFYLGYQSVLSGMSAGKKKLVVLFLISTPGTKLLSVFPQPMRYSQKRIFFMRQFRLLSSYFQRMVQRDFIFFKQVCNKLYYKYLRANYTCQSCSNYKCQGKERKVLVWNEGVYLDFLKIQKIICQFGQMNNFAKNKTIQCYQLIEEIGKGAYGKVYKGINLNNGIFVAMKEIPISKEFIKSIKKEINVLKSLNHKNIVRYQDAIIKDHKIYLILQYLQGGSLGQLCKRSMFPESLIKLYIQQILQGLDYLHKLNIVHRDIKGLNILLTKEGKIKIADFGVAVNISQNQKTLSAGGSPYWMAPQTVNGQEVINPKSDVWSLGCTVIQLMTGSPPYVELGPLPALFRIAEDIHPPLPKNASADCINFLLRCFEKQPDKRASVSQLLQHKWVKSVSQQQQNITRSHKNIRSSNVQVIQTTLRSGNLQQILNLVQKTQSKKLIYYNKYFLVLNDVENSEAKIDIVHYLINSNFQAYKYIQSIGIIKNLFTRECKVVKINPIKSLQLIKESYMLGFQNDIFYMIQNNVVFYLSMLCKQYLTKKQAYMSSLILSQTLCSIVRSFCYDQVILATHVLQIMQEEDTLSSFSVCYNFAADGKNIEIAFSLCRIFNKYVEQNFDLKEAMQIFQYSLQKLCNICIFLNDVKTGEQNLKIVLFLVKFEEFQDKMQIVGLTNYLSEYAKMLVINKNVCEDYVESVSLYFQLILEYFHNKPERSKAFVKAGGGKRLKSLPKFLFQKPQIARKINLINAIINNL